MTDGDAPAPGDAAVERRARLRLEKRLAEATRWYAAGDGDKAAAVCREILRLWPEQPDALHLLGVTAHGRGDGTAAAALIRRALAVRPDLPAAWHNLGSVLARQGRLSAAADAYARAVDLAPEDAGAARALGHALAGLARHDAAVAAYRRALAGAPDDAGTWNSLGNSLRALERLDEAAAAYGEAAAAAPDWAVAHHNLGSVLKRLNRLREAAACHERALARDPGFADAHNGLGNALAWLGRPAEAAGHYRAALAREPHNAAFHNNLARALTELARVDEAMRHFRAALAITPEDAAIRANFLRVLNCSPTLSMAGLFREQRAWDAPNPAPVPATPLRAADDPERRPLTVGVMGHGHTFAYQTGGLALRLAGLENLDPGHFRLIAYADGPVPDDAYSRRFRACCDARRAIGGLDPLTVAGHMRADGLDILLSLAGCMESPVRVCRHRAAPVQVIWGGYGTTGLAAMDWFLADDPSVPPGAEAWYTERIYRLPGGYVVVEPPPDAPPVRPPPVLDNGFVTFGCFNNPAKLNDTVIALWARVLAAVPHSRLRLKGAGFTDAGVCDALRARFAAHGIAGERILFEGAAPHAAFLAAHERVDIGLDPWPYSGGFTTFEALWMGVPVVTLPGTGFASRHAASYLTHAGLPELVAGTADAYVATAAWWAARPHALAALRAALRPRLRASPLCDGPAFGYHLGAALRTMWRAACRAAETGSGP